MILDLPLEIQNYIADELCARDYLCLAGTCRQMYRNIRRGVWQQTNLLRKLVSEYKDPGEELILMFGLNALIPFMQFYMPKNKRKIEHLLACVRFGDPRPTPCVNKQELDLRDETALSCFFSVIKAIKGDKFDKKVFHKQIKKRFKFSVRSISGRTVKTAPFHVVLKSLTKHEFEVSCKDILGDFKETYENVHKCSDRRIDEIEKILLQRGINVQSRLLKKVIQPKKKDVCVFEYMNTLIIGLNEEEVQTLKVEAFHFASSLFAQFWYRKVPGSTYSWFSYRQLVDRNWEHALHPFFAFFKRKGYKVKKAKRNNRLKVWDSEGRLFTRMKIPNDRHLTIMEKYFEL